MLPNKATMILFACGLVAGFLLADSNLISEPAIGKAADGTGGFQPFSKLYGAGFQSGSGVKTA